jgi:hypothetical protein
VEFDWLCINRIFSLSEDFLEDLMMMMFFSSVNCIFLLSEDLLEDLMMMMMMMF